MITEPTHLCLIVLSCTTAALLSVSAIAQETIVASTTRDLEKPWQFDDPRWQPGLHLAYVGGSTAKFQGAHLDESDAINADLEVRSRIPLNDEWFFLIGMMSDNFFLGQVSGAPIPEDIHTLRFHSGLSYRWNQNWTFAAVLSPVLYRFDDIHISDLGISVGALARYHVDPSLNFTFGLFVAPDSDLNVLPVVGVLWRINDHYTLEVSAPRTRLSYRIEPDWEFYGGLDLNGTTFRTTKDLGTKIGLPRFNNALATYRDIRLGVGTGYQLIHGLRAEIEAGVSVYREINYTRIEESVKFEPASYVRLGLGVRF